MKSLRSYVFMFYMNLYFLSLSILIASIMGWVKAINLEWHCDKPQSKVPIYSQKSICFFLLWTPDIAPDIIAFEICAEGFYGSVYKTHSSKNHLTTLVARLLSYTVGLCVRQKHA